MNVDATRRPTLVANQGNTFNTGCVQCALVHHNMDRM